MFDPKQAGRLLRQDWSSPVDLAREIYTLVTSKMSRRGSEPPRIESPKVQAPLPINRERADTALAARPNRPGKSPSKPSRDSLSEAKRPEIVKTEQPETRNPNSPITPPLARPQTVDTPPEKTLERADSKPTTFQLSPRQKSLLPGFPTGKLTAQVQSGPKTYEKPRGIAPPQSPSRKSQRAADPEISGDIRFDGIRPLHAPDAQDAFRIKEDEYDAYDHDGSLTRIPLDVNGGNDVYFGYVVGGEGDTYHCNLFDYPDLSLQPVNFVEVKIASLDPKERVPAKTWIYPVVSNDDGSEWYGMIPMWI